MDQEAEKVCCPQPLSQVDVWGIGVIFWSLYAKTNLVVYGYATLLSEPFEISQASCNICSMPGIEFGASAIVSQPWEWMSFLTTWSLDLNTIALYMLSNFAGANLCVEKES